MAEPFFPFQNMKQLIVCIIFCMINTLCLGQTQQEMNQQALKNYQKADKDLNMMYQKILQLYKNEIPFVTNLKIAQKIWVQFRDAEMKARYPESETGYYGSIFPLCWNNYLQELTEERIRKLKTWLTGVKEGDACAGSLKTIA